MNTSAVHNSSLMGGSLSWMRWQDVERFVKTFACFGQGYLKVVSRQLYDLSTLRHAAMAGIYISQRCLPSVPVFFMTYHGGTPDSS